MDTKNLDRTYIAQTYGRYDAVLTDRAPSGFAGDGRGYIDFGSGIAVNTFGASETGWVDAICTQAHKLSHTSNYFYTEPQSLLAETLCRRTGLKRVFFSNSGAEANECAIKAARKYSHDKYGDGRATILTLENSFHGRTITTLSATGQEVFHTDFMPFTPGFAHIPTNDITALEAAATSDVCALMLELVQGEGGVNLLSAEYVTAAAKLCAERDILLVIDEVQTGNGRTGTLYAFAQFGISPDIVSTAKGLAGGLPLGATLVRARKPQRRWAEASTARPSAATPSAVRAQTTSSRGSMTPFSPRSAQKPPTFAKSWPLFPVLPESAVLGLMIGVALPPRRRPRNCSQVP